MRRLLRGFGTALAAGLFLAFSGAFGMGGESLVGRLLYWTATMLTGTAVAMGVAELFVRRGWVDGPLWRASLVLALAIAVPLTGISWAFACLLSGQPFDWRQLPYFALPVLAVSVVMTALNMALGRAPVTTHAPDPSASGAGGTAVRFLDRLPAKLRGAELHAVSAEDHYLRLHTSRGSDLILFRLADALAELEGLEGAQTHRSWWVAREAVVAARRGDGRAALVLKGGVEAPVSRTYAPSLRQAGWF